MNIERTLIYNTFPAIHGIRNSYNSWEDCDSQGVSIYENDTGWASYNHCLIGTKDLKLMGSLVKAGSSHRKFLRQIFVCVDLKLPVFVWQEMDTYKISTVRNSCSTMHTITHRTLTQEDFEYKIDELTLYKINSFILLYQSEQSSDAKEKIFLTIKNMLPSGFLQKATMTFDYETLLNIYHQRKNHRLPQWHKVCDWIKTLPLMEFIIEEK